MKSIKSFKVKLCLIFALAFIMISTLGAFFGVIASADKHITLSGAGTSAFYTNGSAKIWAHRVWKGEGEEPEATVVDNDNLYYYTMFSFKEDEDTVVYRRNLAYQWFYNKGDLDDSFEPYEGEDGNWWIRGINTNIEYNEEDECTVKNGYWYIGEQKTEVTQNEATEMGEGYLKLKIGFDKVNFEKFTLVFETQQFNMTKDEKTTNYVIFVKANEGENKVYAIIAHDKDTAEKDLEDLLAEEAVGHVALDMDNIVIELGEDNSEKGLYAVTVYNDGNKEGGQKDTFKNVGKTYAKYVQSSKSVYPITFKAEFAKDGDDKYLEGQTTARMALYELNGQSFLLNRDIDEKPLESPSSRIDYHENDGDYYYAGGQVNDTQPPMLCLDSGISYVKEGDELSFSYTAIDVLTQSPGTETFFFMLTKEQKETPDFDAESFVTERLFKKVTADEDVLIYPHANHVKPVYGTDYATGGKGTAFSNETVDDDFLPNAAIKIYLKLTDATANQSTCILLDWYVKNEYKLNIGGYDYIAVATDKVGATYNYGEGKTSFTEDNEIWQAYNQKVQEAAKNLRAGSDEDFYLPSVETLISDKATAYEDMTYSIYYMVNGTTSSVSSRRSSQLYIDLSNEGDYIFTVYATDSASKKMWYMDGDEKVEFAASEIWTMYDDEDEEGLHDRLPWFTFTAGLADITIEDPGEQSTAYVGTTYTASAFEVKGISTQTTHKLYVFNNALYYKEKGEVLSYEKFMEIKKELFEGTGEYEGGKKYFTEIMPRSELEENSEEYDEFYDYAWNPAGRSFVPQSDNDFYLIKCEVTSTKFPARTAVSEYMGIVSSRKPTPLKGEDTWVQDNITSIILLSIAGAAFVGIILLIFVKPKNKGDIDVQFDEEVKSKKAKKK